MKPFSSAPDAASLARGWAKGEFHPAYLFAGPDALRKEEALKRFLELFLPGADGGLNVDRFDGDTASAADILNAFHTPGFLTPRRAVVVRRAEGLPAAQAVRVAEGLGGKAGENCLMLLWDDKADARNVLVQAVKSAGLVLTFWTPFENQLPRWVQERAQTLQKSISPGAAQALLEKTGPNLSVLAQELEKLSLYVGERKTIEDADVEAMGGDLRTLQFMEFDKALWARDRRKALSLLTELRAEGEAPEALLGQWARSYRKMLLAKSLLQEKTVTREEMWDRLWIRTREPQELLLKALGTFSWDDLLAALEGILQAEWELKTGRLDPGPGLTLLLCQLTEGKREEVRRGG